MLDQFPNTMRGSFNKEDTADTTAEMAVQGRPPRSILKALVVCQVGPSIVRDVIEREHYLRSMPVASRLCFGVFLDDVLVGATVFTSGARHGHRSLDAAKPDDVLTLARLWLSDALPGNSESRVLGIVLRELRRTTTIKLVLSYADPEAGHVGTIYQASGWLYLGQTEPGGYVRLADGKLYHPRTIYNRYGSNRIRHLQATGIPARRKVTGRKHRYAYMLDRSWAWRLRGHARPYPRSEVGDGTPA
jgi:hypothetical protein